jgi:hypothetical protein
MLLLAKDGYMHAKEKDNWVSRGYSVHTDILQSKTNQSINASLIVAVVVVVVLLVGHRVPRGPGPGPNLETNCGT